MDKIRSLRLRHLHGRLGEIVYQFTQVQSSHAYAPAKWSPAVNAYRCQECVSICVDLAGVDSKGIALEVEPQRVLIRGQRPPPEPEGGENKALQILALEIDHGEFEREIRLPFAVDPDRVTAEQRNGLLWIFLPLRAHG